MNELNKQFSFTQYQHLCIQWEYDSGPLPTVILPLCIYFLQVQFGPVPDDGDHLDATIEDQNIEGEGTQLKRLFQVAPVGFLTLHCTKVTVSARICSS